MLNMSQQLQDLVNDIESIADLDDTAQYHELCSYKRITENIVSEEEDIYYPQHIDENEDNDTNVEEPLSFD